MFRKFGAARRSIGTLRQSSNYAETFQRRPADASNVVSPSPTTGCNHLADRRSRNGGHPSDRQDSRLEFNAASIMLNPRSLLRRCAGLLAGRQPGGETFPRQCGDSFSFEPIISPISVAARLKGGCPPRSIRSGVPTICASGLSLNLDSTETFCLRYRQLGSTSADIDSVEIR